MASYAISPTLGVYQGIPPPLRISSRAMRSAATIFSTTVLIDAASSSSEEARGGSILSS